MFDTAKKIINEKKINTNELNKSVIGARRELDNFLKQINRNYSTKKELVKKIDKNNTNSNFNNEKLNILKKEKYNIESNKNKISASLDALDSKYAFYEELINASEGYPKGVRDVLNNKKIFKGVLGTVGDINKG